MRALLALAAAVLVTGCAGGPTSGPAPAASANGKVGYVRMDELVKKHPLYGQLAQYDQNIAALNLDALVPRALAGGSDLAREDARLNAQLQAAAKRTDALLQAKGKAYQDRENAAIAAALRQAGNAGRGASVGGVAAQMEGTAQGQVAGAASQAEHDLDTYRRELEAQDAAQIDAAQKTLAARADRTYRAKVDQIDASESALSLELAKADATERLSLRTKLSSLALDDAQRDEVNKQLAALDQKEGDALAAQHNKDAAVLSALQAQLRAQVGRDMQGQVTAIHAQSLQRYQERAKELQTEFAPSNGPLVTAMKDGKPTTEVNPSLPPAIRTRIEQLHADYAKAYQSDAQATIADFNKTRDDLSRRYAQLHGTDAAATQSAQNEIVTLQRKRQELYDQMVAQIGREVKTIAQQRGIGVVVDAEVPAGGVDLTDDAMKDIETLHE